MPKVLIAEDDLMIADLLEEELVKRGYEVCGIARTVSEGVNLAQVHKPDFAILDLRLAQGGFGTEIAAQLTCDGGRQGHRPGILYATGNSSELTSADGDASLRKPYRIGDLMRSLDIVAGLVFTGTASGPFPPGFQLLKGNVSSPG